MRPTFAAALFALPAVVLAQGSAPTDEQILNYALTLEHLENAFYAGALGQFDDAAFTKAKLTRTRFAEIGAHEAAHVQFLTTALADKATKPCNYSFPYTDVPSFVGLAAVLEGVGVSAYLGAAKYITNKDYLTAAGAILTTESRHAAYIASVGAANGDPWSGPLDVPLDLDQVYSLAAQFITGCPSSNPALPVKAFPPLNLTSTSYFSGGALNISYAPAKDSDNIVFYSGLSRTLVPLKGMMTVTIPAGLMGTSYAVVTSTDNATMVSDDNIVAGPAILILGPSPANMSSPSPSQGNSTAPPDAAVAQMLAKPAVAFLAAAFAVGLSL